MATGVKVEAQPQTDKKTPVRTESDSEESKADRKMSRRRSEDILEQRSSHTGKVASSWEDWQSCESQQMGSNAEW